MNQRKNGLTQSDAAHQALGRLARQPQPHKLSVTSPKAVVAPQMKTPPAAPPVYRPQPSPNSVQPKMTIGAQNHKRQAVPASQIKPGVAQQKTAFSAQSVKQPVAPPVYRPQAKPVGVQAKMAGISQSKNHPVAPPVYEPQPVPKVLQTKKTVSRQVGQGQQEHKPLAFSVNRIQKTAGIAQSKMTAAPPPYSLSASIPPVRTHHATNSAHCSANGPNRTRAIQRQIPRITQPNRERKGKTVSRANAIQLHPLAIKIPGFYEWKRDTGEINLEDDIEIFREKVRGDDPKITSIEVKKKNTGDHQVVVIGMEGGQFMQMDLSDSGTMLRYDVDEDHYSVVVGTFTPNKSLRLHDVFRAFLQVTHAKGFDFTDYNCIRFANNLAGTIGTFDRNQSDGEDMSFLF